MRLLKIGRDASCNIVMHSEKVSSVHAELTILNSGDMMVEDKGSRNGTFIMNQRIAPNKPVNVKRGDAIRFADVELQWSQVPMPEDNSAYKGIYGIGSHFNNDIQISGSTVSRYHATIKHGKDGKMYVVDHSKNGTTVDGVRISSNTPIRIKKNSALVCGGVPVNTSSLPWPSSAWKYTVGIAAAIVVIAGLVFGAVKIWPGRDSGPSLQALQNATAQVIGMYYYEVKIKDDPFVGVVDGWPEKWVFGYNKKGQMTLGSCLGGALGSDISPIAYNGTAFFISENGELGTNRHIACPWDLEYDNMNYADEIRQIMTLVLNNEDVVRYVANETVSKKGVSDAILRLQRLNTHDLIFSGSFEYLGVGLAGTNWTSIADLQSCQVIAESKDKDKDVAMLRLNSKITPPEIVKGGFFDIKIARTDEKSLLPQEDEMTTIGFPSEKGTGSNIISKGKEYLPTVHRTYVSKTPDENGFQLQSNVVGGQSGSPVIDKKHRLVGVVWGSHRGTDVAYACNIKHLKELYDKNKVVK